MRLHYYLLCAFSIIAISALSAKPSLAQTPQPLTPHVLDYPYGDQFGDSQDNCPVYFQTGDFAVEFIGPLNGSVTWSGSILASITGNDSVDWKENIKGQPIVKKIGDGGSDTLSLATGVHRRKDMYCYGTALYRSTHDYAAQGKATVSYTLPASAQGSDSGTIVCNIKKHAP